MSDHKRPFTAYAFNQYLGEGKLMASRCASCETIHLPVRAICPACSGEALEWIEMSGKGTLAAFTAVHIGPTFMNQEGFDRKNPYLTGVVELAEGPKISARLLGFDPLQPDQVKIGSPLALKVVEVGAGDQTRPQLAFQAVEP